MLTVDQVRTRRRGTELFLSGLTPKTQPSALYYASEYLDRASACVGQRRGELDSSFEEVSVTAKDLKLAAGIRKLVEDRCGFDVDESIDPAALRQQVFELAAQERLTASESAPWERDRVLSRASEQLGLSPAVIEENLYADLRDAHRLKTFQAVSPEALLAEYELSQAQSVLLRATKVVVYVEARDAASYRKLFRTMKFRRLLCTIRPEKAGYCIEVDGPLSLFTSATKYGLALALLLPAIREMDRWSLAAEVLWGKKRDRLLFRLSGEANCADSAVIPLPDEVERLLERWPSLNSGWVPHARAEILNLPGVGISVPDLAFEHTETGEVVYLEVMGYWSRDAVWRRVELVEAGLQEKILFAVSTKLRVSEAVLDENLPGALLVYKGTIPPKAVLEKLELLRTRSSA